MLNVDNKHVAILNIYCILFLLWFLVTLIKWMASHFIISLVCLMEESLKLSLCVAWLSVSDFDSVSTTLQESKGLYLMTCAIYFIDLNWSSRIFLELQNFFVLRQYTVI